jgi:hypothetical protein
MPAAHAHKAAAAVAVAAAVAGEDWWDAQLAQHHLLLLLLLALRLQQLGCHCHPAHPAAAGLKPAVQRAPTQLLELLLLLLLLLHLPAVAVAQLQPLLRLGCAAAASGRQLLRYALLG